MNCFRIDSRYTAAILPLWWSFRIAVSLKTTSMGRQSENLQKTRANLYTLATKIVDINYIVINSLLNKPFIVQKNWTVFVNNFDDLNWIKAF